MELKAEVIQPIIEEHGDSLAILFHDTDKEADMSLLLQFESNFNVTQGAAQELFFPDTVLIGYEEILQSGETVILQQLSNRSLWKSAKYPNATNTSSTDNALLKEKVDRFSFWAIVGLGIVDGINPCAIATMIFLISFMAAQKRSRRDILIIGLSYTTTVFVTYTIIGVTAFEFLSVMKQTAIISSAIKWIAVALAGTVALLSFIDAFRFKKSGDTKTITLQLPNSIKKQIHKVINGNMKQGNLVAGTIITGFLVTLLETFCTGQTYLPAIQAMVKSSELRAEGWGRLLFYNLLFVLPLLIVMVAAYFGMTWNALAKKTQKNMVLLKIILGVVMTFLTVYLAFS